MEFDSLAEELVEIWRIGSLTHKSYKSQFTLISGENIFLANLLQNIRMEDGVTKWLLYLFYWNALGIP